TLSGSPLRVQIPPQQNSVTYSWTGRENSVTRSRDRSTWSGPSTVFRISRPALKVGLGSLLSLSFIMAPLATGGVVSCSRVFARVDLIEPVSGSERDRSVDHEGVHRGTVPVPLARSSPDDIARAERQRLAAVTADPARSRCHQQDLA